MLAFLLALLLAGADSGPTGDLQLNVAAGTEVVVDGTSYGVASTAGATVRGLSAGAHRVDLKAPNGGVAGFNVNIVAAQTQTINVSPLGFRIKPKNEVPVAAVRIQSEIAPCEVAVGDVAAEKTSHELNIGTVPTGKQKLVIDCGNRQHVEAMLNLADGELQVIEPDFATGTAKIVARRRRVTALNVNSGQEAIVNAGIPVEWKRALSAAAGPARAVSVTPVSLMQVVITYRCPSVDEAMRVIDRLRNQGVVERIDVMGVKRDGEAAIVSMRVKFRPS